MNDFCWARWHSGASAPLSRTSTFAFRIIIDIALKALSSAINDPTTAVIAIDQLQPLLRTVANRNLHDERILDGDGRLGVNFRIPNWEDFVHLTFSEIHLYGAGNFARRLRTMIENALQSVPEARVPALRQELDLLDRAVEQSYKIPEDLARARTPDSLRLGGASKARTKPRLEQV